VTSATTPCPAGKGASRSTTTTTSTRTSRTCSRPRRQSPSWTARARTVPHLVYFDQWTGPVAGEILADHADIEVARLEITGGLHANASPPETAHGEQHAESHA